MNKQMEINPFAVLAAVLANLDQTHKAKVKPDDATEEIELDVPVISLAKNDDAILLKFPLEKLVQIQMSPYDVKLAIENGTVVIFFQKAAVSTGLVGANGQKIVAVTDKPLIQVQ